MSHLDDAASPVQVRDDLVSTHENLLRHVVAPGTWWDGTERRAIAEAARAARACRLCAQRKAAVSPFAVDGDHDGPDELHPDVIDAVHRIVTDPGRLTKSWYERMVAGDALDPERYVELVSVTVFVTALDVFARALGLEPIPLPAARSGEPSLLRPPSAHVDRAWVPQLLVGPGGGPEWSALYDDRTDVSEVERALSLVPAEVEVLNGIAATHYMAFRHVPDPFYAEASRAIDRTQTELVASRVSAINECFY